jgi:diguanylate cyclase (GGDEF)-like protein/PAS domain S-box-containing protein
MHHPGVQNPPPEADRQWIEVLSRVLDRSRDFVTIIGIDGRLLYANETVREFFGVKAQDDLRAVPPTLGFTRESLRTLRDEVWPTLLCEEAWRGELTLRAPDGSFVIVLQTSQLHRDDNGRPAFVAGIGRDITELKSAQSRLRALATQDDLTGLANRPAALERLRAVTDVDPTTPRAVLFIDLDGFKLVNDHHGHAVGDKLLELVAARLRASVRGDDLVARLGGDEFLVLCDAEGARDVAERVLGSLRRPFDVGGLAVEVGASVGIATVDPHDPLRALRDADAAMYRAKRSPVVDVVHAPEPAWR